MLSDSSHEIRQQADSALSEFLQEIKNSPVRLLLTLNLQFFCLQYSMICYIATINLVPEIFYQPPEGGRGGNTLLTIRLSAFSLCNQRIAIECINVKYFGLRTTYSVHL